MPDSASSLDETTTLQPTPVGSFEEYFLILRDLLYAIRIHDLDTVRITLQQYPSLAGGDSLFLSYYKTLPLYDLYPTTASKSLDFSPLHVAILEDDEEIVALLLQCGFCPVYYINDFPFFLLTSDLNIAIANGNLQIVKLLLAYHHHYYIKSQLSNIVAAPTCNSFISTTTNTTITLPTLASPKLQSPESQAEATPTTFTMPPFPINYYDQHDISTIFHFCGLSVLVPSSVSSDLVSLNTATATTTSMINTVLSPQTCNGSQDFDVTGFLSTTHGTTGGISLSSLYNKPNSTTTSNSTRNDTLSAIPNSNSSQGVDNHITVTSVRRDILIFPLELAFRINHFEIIELLMIYGADINNPFFSKTILSIVFSHFYSAALQNEHLLKSLQFTRAIDLIKNSNTNQRIQKPEILLPKDKSDLTRGSAPAHLNSKASKPLFTEYFSHLNTHITPQIHGDDHYIDALLGELGHNTNYNADHCEDESQYQQQYLNSSFYQNSDNNSAFLSPYHGYSVLDVSINDNIPQYAANNSIEMPSSSITFQKGKTPTNSHKMTYSNPNILPSSTNFIVTSLHDVLHQQTAYINAKTAAREEREAQMAAKASKNAVYSDTYHLPNRPSIGSSAGTSNAASPGANIPKGHNVHFSSTQQSNFLNLSAGATNFFVQNAQHNGHQSNANANSSSNYQSSPSTSLSSLSNRSNPIQITGPNDTVTPTNPTVQPWHNSSTTSPTIANLQNSGKFSPFLNPTTPTSQQHSSQQNHNQQQNRLFLDRMNHSYHNNGRLFGNQLHSATPQIHKIQSTTSPYQSHGNPFLQFPAKLHPNRVLQQLETSILLYTHATYTHSLQFSQNGVALGPSNPFGVFENVFELLFFKYKLNIFTTNISGFTGLNEIAANWIDNDLLSTVLQSHSNLYALRPLITKNNIFMYILATTMPLVYNSFIAHHRFDLNGLNNNNKSTVLLNFEPFSLVQSKHKPQLQGIQPNIFRYADYINLFQYYYSFRAKLLTQQYDHFLANYKTYISEKLQYIQVVKQIKSLKRSDVSNYTRTKASLRHNAQQQMLRELILKQRADKVGDSNDSGEFGAIRPLSQSDEKVIQSEPKKLLNNPFLSQLNNALARQQSSSSEVHRIPTYFDKITKSENFDKLETTPKKFEKMETVDESPTVIPPLPTKPIRPEFPSFSAFESYYEPHGLSYNYFYNPTHHIPSPFLHHTTQSGIMPTSFPLIFSHPMDKTTQVQSPPPQPPTAPDHLAENIYFLSFFFPNTLPSFFIRHQLYQAYHESKHFSNIAINALYNTKVESFLQHPALLVMSSHAKKALACAEREEMEKKQLDSLPSLPLNNTGATNSFQTPQKGDKNEKLTNKGFFSPKDNKSDRNDNDYSHNHTKLAHINEDNNVTTMSPKPYQTPPTLETSPNISYTGSNSPQTPHSSPYTPKIPQKLALDPLSIEFEDDLQYYRLQIDSSLSQYHTSSHGLHESDDFYRNRSSNISLRMSQTSLYTTMNNSMGQAMPSIQSHLSAPSSNVGSFTNAHSFAPTRESKEDNMGSNLMVIPTALAPSTLPPTINNFADYMRAVRALYSGNAATAANASVSGAQQQAQSQPSVIQQYISLSHLTQRIATVSQVTSLSIILDSLLDLALNGDVLNNVRNIFFSPIILPYLIPFYYHFLHINEVCAMLTRPQAFMYAVITKRLDVLMLITTYNETEYIFRLDEAWDPSFFYYLHLAYINATKVTEQGVSGFINFVSPPSDHVHTHNSAHRDSVFVYDRVSSVQNPGAMASFSQLSNASSINIEPPSLTKSSRSGPQSGIVPTFNPHHVMTPSHSSSANSSTASTPTSSHLTFQPHIPNNSSQFTGLSLLNVNHSDTDQHAPSYSPRHTPSSTTPSFIAFKSGPFASPQTPQTNSTPRQFFSPLSLNGNGPSQPDLSTSSCSLVHSSTPPLSALPDPIEPAFTSHPPSPTQKDRLGKDFTKEREKELKQRQKEQEKQQKKDAKDAEKRLKEAAKQQAKNAKRGGLVDSDKPENKNELSQGLAVFFGDTSANQAIYNEISAITGPIDLDKFDIYQSTDTQPNQSTTSTSKRINILSFFGTSTKKQQKIHHITTKIHNLVHTTSTTISTTLPHLSQTTLEDLEATFQLQNYYHSNNILSFPSLITIHGSLLMVFLLKSAWVAGIEVILRNSYQLVPHVYSSVFLSNSTHPALSAGKDNSANSNLTPNLMVTQHDFFQLRRAQKVLLQKYTDLLYNEYGQSPNILFWNYDVSMATSGSVSNALSTKNSSFNVNNKHLPTISAEVMQVIADFRMDWVKTSLKNITTIIPGYNDKEVKEKTEKNDPVVNVTGNDSNASFDGTYGDNMNAPSPLNKRKSILGSFFGGKKDKKDKKEEKSTPTLQDPSRYDDMMAKISGNTDSFNMETSEVNTDQDSGPTAFSVPFANGSGNLTTVQKHFTNIIHNAPTNGIYVLNHPYYTTIAERFSLMFDTLRSSFISPAHGALSPSSLNGQVASEGVLSALHHVSPIVPLLSVTSYLEFQSLLQIAGCYNIPAFTSAFLPFSAHFQQHHQQVVYWNNIIKKTQQHTLLYNVNAPHLQLNKMLIKGFEFVLSDPHQRYYPIEVVMRVNPETNLPLNHILSSKYAGNTHNSRRFSQGQQDSAALKIPTQNYYYLHMLNAMFNYTDQSHLTNLLTLLGDIDSSTFLRTININSVKQLLAQWQLQKLGEKVHSINHKSEKSLKNGLNLDGSHENHENPLFSSIYPLVAIDGTITYPRDSGSYNSTQVSQVQSLSNLPYHLLASNTAELQSILTKDEAKYLKLLLCSDIILAMMSGNPSALNFILNLQKNVDFTLQTHNTPKTSDCHQKISVSIPQKALMPPQNPQISQNVSQNTSKPSDTPQDYPRTTSSSQFSTTTSSHGQFHTLVLPSAQRGTLNTPQSLNGNNYEDTHVVPKVSNIKSPKTGLTRSRGGLFEQLQGGTLLGGDLAGELSDLSDTSGSTLSLRDSSSIPGSIHSPNSPLHGKKFEKWDKTGEIDLNGPLQIAASPSFSPKSTQLQQQGRQYSTVSGHKRIAHHSNLHEFEFEHISTGRRPSDAGEEDSPSDFDDDDTPQNGIDTNLYKKGQKGEGMRKFPRATGLAVLLGTAIDCLDSERSLWVDHQFSVNFFNIYLQQCFSGYNAMIALFSGALHSKMSENTQVLQVMEKIEKMATKNSSYLVDLTRFSHQQVTQHAFNLPFTPFIGIISDNNAVNTIYQPFAEESHLTFSSNSSIIPSIMMKSDTTQSISSKLSNSHRLSLNPHKQEDKSNKNSINQVDITSNQSEENSVPNISYVKQPLNLLQEFTHKLFTPQVINDIPHKMASVYCHDCHFYSNIVIPALIDIYNDDNNFNDDQYPHIFAKKAEFSAFFEENLEKGGKLENSRGNDIPESLSHSMVSYPCEISCVSSHAPTLRTADSSQKFEKNQEKPHRQLQPSSPRVHQRTASTHLALTLSGQSDQLTPLSSTPLISPHASEKPLLSPHNAGVVPVILPHLTGPFSPQGSQNNNMFAQHSMLSTRNSPQNAQNQTFSPYSGNKTTNQIPWTQSNLSPPNINNSLYKPHFLTPMQQNLFKKLNVSDYSRFYADFCYNCHYCSSVFVSILAIMTPEENDGENVLNFSTFTPNTIVSPQISDNSSNSSSQHRQGHSVSRFTGTGHSLSSSLSLSSSFTSQHQFPLVKPIGLKVVDSTQASQYRANISSNRPLSDHKRGITHNFVDNGEKLPQNDENFHRNERNRHILLDSILEFTQRQHIYQQQWRQLQHREVIYLLQQFLSDEIGAKPITQIDKNSEKSSKIEQINVKYHASNPIFNNSIPSSSILSQNPLLYTSIDPTQTTNIHSRAIMGLMRSLQQDLRQAAVMARLRQVMSMQPQTLSLVSNLSNLANFSAFGGITAASVDQQLLQNQHNTMVFYQHILSLPMTPVVLHAPPVGGLFTGAEVSHTSSPNVPSHGLSAAQQTTPLMNPPTGPLSSLSLPNQVVIAPNKAALLTFEQQLELLPITHIQGLILPFKLKKSFWNSKDRTEQVQFSLLKLLPNTFQRDLLQHYTCEQTEQLYIVNSSRFFSQIASVFQQKGEKEREMLLRERREKEDLDAIIKTQDFFGPTIGQLDQISSNTQSPVTKSSDSDNQSQTNGTLFSRRRSLVYMPETDLTSPPLSHPQDSGKQETRQILFSRNPSQREASIVRSSGNKQALNLAKIEIATTIEDEASPLPNPEQPVLSPSSPGPIPFGGRGRTSSVAPLTRHHNRGTNMDRAASIVRVREEYKNEEQFVGNIPQQVQNNTATDPRALARSIELDTRVLLGILRVHLVDHQYFDVLTVLEDLDRGLLATKQQPAHMLLRDQWKDTWGMYEQSGVPYHGRTLLHTMAKHYSSVLGNSECKLTQQSRQSQQDSERNDSTYDPVMPNTISNDFLTSSTTAIGTNFKHSSENRTQQQSVGLSTPDAVLTVSGSTIEAFMLNGNHQNTEKENLNNNIANTHLDGKKIVVGSFIFDDNVSNDYLTNDSIHQRYYQQYRRNSKILFNKKNMTPQNPSFVQNNITGEAFSNMTIFTDNGTIAPSNASQTSQKIINRLGATPRVSNHMPNSDSPLISSLSSNKLKVGNSTSILTGKHQKRHSEIATSSTFNFAGNKGHHKRQLSTQIDPISEDSPLDSAQGTQNAGEAKNFDSFPNCNTFISVISVASELSQTSSSNDTIGQDGGKSSEDGENTLNTVMMNTKSSNSPLLGLDDSEPMSLFSIENDLTPVANHYAGHSRRAQFAYHRSSAYKQQLYYHIFRKEQFSFYYHNNRQHLIDLSNLQLVVDQQNQILTKHRHSIELSLKAKGVILSQFTSLDKTGDIIANFDSSTPQLARTHSSNLKSFNITSNNDVETVNFDEQLQQQQCHVLSLLYPYSFHNDNILHRNYSFDPQETLVEKEAQRNAFIERVVKLIQNDEQSDLIIKADRTSSSTGSQSIEKPQFSQRLLNYDNSRYTRFSSHHIALSDSDNECEHLETEIPRSLTSKKSLNEKIDHIIQFIGLIYDDIVVQQSADYISPHRLHKIMHYLQFHTYSHPQSIENLKHDESNSKCLDFSDLCRKMAEKQQKIPDLIDPDIFIQMCVEDDDVVNQLYFDIPPLRVNFNENTSNSGKVMEQWTLPVKDDDSLVFSPSIIKSIPKREKIVIKQRKFAFLSNFSQKQRDLSRNNVQSQLILKSSKLSQSTVVAAKALLSPLQQWLDTQYKTSPFFTTKSPQYTMMNKLSGLNNHNSSDIEHDENNLYCYCAQCCPFASESTESDASPPESTDFIETTRLCYKCCDLPFDMQYNLTLRRYYALQEKKHIKLRLSELNLSEDHHSKSIETTVTTVPTMFNNSAEKNKESAKQSCTLCKHPQMSQEDYIKALKSIDDQAKILQDAIYIDCPSYLREFSNYHVNFGKVQQINIETIEHFEKIEKLQSFRQIINTTLPFNIHEHQYAQNSIPAKYIEPTTQFPYFYRFLIQNTPLVPFDTTFTLSDAWNNNIAIKPTHNQVLMDQASTSLLPHRHALAQQHAQLSQQQCYTTQQHQLLIAQQVAQGGIGLSLQDQEKLKSLLVKAGVVSANQPLNVQDILSSSVALQALQKISSANNTNATVSNALNSTILSRFDLFPYVNLIDTQRRCYIYDTSQQNNQEITQYHVYNSPNSIFSNLLGIPFSTTPVPQNINLITLQQVYNNHFGTPATFASSNFVGISGNLPGSAANMPSQHHGTPVNSIIAATQPRANQNISAITPMNKKHLLTRLYSTQNCGILQYDQLDVLHNKTFISPSIVEQSHYLMHNIPTINKYNVFSMSTSLSYFAEKNVQNIEENQVDELSSLHRYQRIKHLQRYLLQNTVDTSAFCSLQYENSEENSLEKMANIPSEDTPPVHKNLHSDSPEYEQSLLTLQIVPSSDGINAPASSSPLASVKDDLKSHNKPAKIKTNLIAYAQRVKQLQAVAFNTYDSYVSTSVPHYSSNLLTTIPTQSVVSNNVICVPPTPLVSNISSTQNHLGTTSPHSAAQDALNQLHITQFPWLHVNNYQDLSNYIFSFNSTNNSQSNWPYKSILQHSNINHLYTHISTLTTPITAPPPPTLLNTNEKIRDTHNYLGGISKTYANSDIMPAITLLLQETTNQPWLNQNKLLNGGYDLGVVLQSRGLGLYYNHSKDKNELYDSIVKLLRDTEKKKKGKKHSKKKLLCSQCLRDNAAVAQKTTLPAVFLLPSQTMLQQSSCPSNANESFNDFNLDGLDLNILPHTSPSMTTLEKVATSEYCKQCGLDIARSYSSSSLLTSTETLSSCSYDESHIQSSGMTSHLTAYHDQQVDELTNQTDDDSLDNSDTFEYETTSTHFPAEVASISPQPLIPQNTVIDRAQKATIVTNLLLQRRQSHQVQVDTSSFFTRAAVLTSKPQIAQVASHLPQQPTDSARTSMRTSQISHQTDGANSLRTSQNVLFDKSDLETTRLSQNTSTKYGESEFSHRSSEKGNIFDYFAEKIEKTSTLAKIIPTRDITLTAEQYYTTATSLAHTNHLRFFSFIAPHKNTIPTTTISQKSQTIVPSKIDKDGRDDFDSYSYLYTSCIGFISPFDHGLSNINDNNDKIRPIEKFTKIPQNIPQPQPPLRSLMLSLPIDISTQVTVGIIPKSTRNPHTTTLSPFQQYVYANIQSNRITLDSPFFSELQHSLLISQQALLPAIYTTTRGGSVSLSSPNASISKLNQAKYQNAQVITPYIPSLNMFPLSLHSNTQRTSFSDLLATPQDHQLLATYYNWFNITYPWYPPYLTTPTMNHNITQGNGLNNSAIHPSTTTRSNPSRFEPIQPPLVFNTTTTTQSGHTWAQPLTPAIMPTFTNEHQFTTNWHLLYYHTITENISTHLYDNMLKKAAILRKSAMERKHQQIMYKKMYKNGIRVEDGENVDAEVFDEVSSQFGPLFPKITPYQALLAATGPSFDSKMLYNPLNYNIDTNNHQNTPLYTNLVDIFKQYLKTYKNTRNGQLSSNSTQLFKSQYNPKLIKLLQTIHSIYSPILLTLHHSSTIILSLLLQFKDHRFAWELLNVLQYHPYNTTYSRNILDFTSIDTINYTDLTHTKLLLQHRPPTMQTSQCNSLLYSTAKYVYLYHHDDCLQTIMFPSQDAPCHPTNPLSLLFFYDNNRQHINYSWIDTMVNKVYNNPFTTIQPYNRKLLLLNQKLIFYYLSQKMNGNYTNEMGSNLLINLILHLNTIKVLPLNVNTAQYLPDFVYDLSFAENRGSTAIFTNSRHVSGVNTGKFIHNTIYHSVDIHIPPNNNLSTSISNNTQNRYTSNHTNTSIFVDATSTPDTASSNAAYYASKSQYYQHEQHLTTSLILTLLTRYNVSLFSTCIDVYTHLGTLTPLHVIILCGLKGLLLDIIKCAPMALLTPIQRELYQFQHNSQESALWKLLQYKQYYERMMEQCYNKIASQVGELNAKICSCCENSSSICADKWCVFRCSPEISSQNANLSVISLTHDDFAKLNSSHVDITSVSRSSVLNHYTFNNSDSLSVTSTPSNINPSVISSSIHPNHLKKQHATYAEKLSNINALIEKKNNTQKDESTRKEFNLPISFPNLTIMHHNLLQCIDDVYNIGLLYQNIFYFNIEYILYRYYTAQKKSSKQNVGDSTSVSSVVNVLLSANTPQLSTSNNTSSSNAPSAIASVPQMAVRRGTIVTAPSSQGGTQSVPQSQAHTHQLTSLLTQHEAFAHTAHNNTMFSLVLDETPIPVSVTTPSRTSRRSPSGHSSISKNTTSSTPYSQHSAHQSALLTTYNSHTNSPIHSSQLGTPQNDSIQHYTLLPQFTTQNDIFMQYYTTLLSREQHKTTRLKSTLRHINLDLNINQYVVYMPPTLDLSSFIQLYYYNVSFSHMVKHVPLNHQTVPNSNSASFTTASRISGTPSSQPHSSKLINPFGDITQQLQQIHPMLQLFDYYFYNVLLMKDCIHANIKRVDALYDYCGIDYTQALCLFDEKLQ